MTPKELALRLAEDVEAVARHLLPNGHKAGQEWRVGSIRGEAGQSLGIHLSGNKAGVWCDFAAGTGGDLLDLWAAVNGLDIRTAIREVKNYLGIQEPTFRGYARKEYKTPSVPKCHAVKPDSPVFDYLTKERKLTPKTIACYRVAESGHDIIFPFLRDDKSVMVKRLKLQRGPDGKKDIRPTSANQEPALFGWQALPSTARTVVICEGEIDAMSWFQYGYPALSVPFGGGKGAKQAWIEAEFPHLERFDEIFLSMDNDPEGEAAVAEIVERLGRHRCRVIHLPFKDCNECLKLDIPAAEMTDFYLAARTMDPTELKPAHYFQDAVIREFYPPEGFSTGFYTPWSKVGTRLMFRPGEVTILFGVNGHGKSEGAGHITLGALCQGERACIASLEFKPPKWLYRITRQAAGMRGPSIPYIKAINSWFRDKLWVFDVVGTAKVIKIMESFTYARQRYNIRLFIIDNLSKLDVSLDDYTAQRDFVDGLTDFAKEYDAHVILVAHSRKTQDDSRPAGKFDVKGSGAITDLADTVLLWWRNRPKEEEIRRAGDQASETTLNKPDAIIKCQKQRNGEEEPTIVLWFHKESHQFLETYSSGPTKYVEFSTSQIGR
jgi:twinkle protein